MPKEVDKSRLQQEHPLGGGSGTSSESGDSHEIKFTKQEGCTACTCACVFIAITFVALGSAAGIYFGFQFLTQRSSNDRVFKGNFLVLEGERFVEDLANTSSKMFQEKAEKYRKKLDQLFNASNYKECYHHSEILAIDNEQGKNIIVHFNIHLLANNVEVDAGDLYFILSEEVMRSESEIFKGLKIDHNSIQIQERKLPSDTISDPWSPRRQYPGSLVGLTTKTPLDRARRCMAIELDFCKGLDYNTTSYPNVVGHKNLQEIKKELISYRQIIDFECYALAREFLCKTLQPACDNNKMVPPCRDFCSDFRKACKNLLPKEVDSGLNCTALPKYSGKASCIPKPGCVEELKSQGKQDLICDGVLDCPDMSDEQKCNYCREGQFYCGDLQCVDPEKRCDNNFDCRNGADEHSCLYLSSDSNDTNNHYYNKEGFLSYTEKGKTRKICVENGNNTLLLARRDMELRQLAMTTCSKLDYKVAEHVVTLTDPDVNGSRVRIVDPLSPYITIRDEKCPGKQVVRMKCSDLECGKRPLRDRPSNEIRPGNDVFRVAHGEWPWHVPIFRNGKHTCDAVMVGENWLLTASACFENGRNDQWTGLFGAIRLSSNSKYVQERKILRIIKSPESRSQVALLKLYRPANTSDYVRPACLPTSHQKAQVGDTCYVFFWDLKKQDLYRAQMRIQHDNECRDQVVGQSNFICAKPIATSFSHTCNEEVVTTPLVCRIDHKWYIQGVTARSTLCKDFHQSQSFHRLSAHADWISHVVSITGDP